MDRQHLYIETMDVKEVCRHGSTNKQLFQRGTFWLKLLSSLDILYAVHSGFIIHMLVFCSKEFQKSLITWTKGINRCPGYLTPEEPKICKERWLVGGFLFEILCAKCFGFGLFSANSYHYVSLLSTFDCKLRLTTIQGTTYSLTTNSCLTSSLFKRSEFF